MRSLQLCMPPWRARGRCWSGCGRVAEPVRSNPAPWLLCRDGLVTTLLLSPCPDTRFHALEVRGVQIYTLTSSRYVVAVRRSKWMVAKPLAPFFSTNF